MKVSLCVRNQIYVCFSLYYEKNSVNFSYPVVFTMNRFTSSMKLDHSGELNSRFFIPIPM